MHALCPGAAAVPMALTGADFFVQVDVAFSVVRVETLFGTKRGMATTWLDRLAAPLTGRQAGPDPALVKASDATLRVPVKHLYAASCGCFL